MAQEQEDYRMKYIENKLDSHEERIKGVEKLTTEFTKISVILERQTEMNEKQDLILVKINDNLTNLNYKSDTLNGRVDNLESEIKDVKNGDTVSVSGLTRKIGWTVLSLTIGAVMAFLFAQFGM